MKTGMKEMKKEYKKIDIDQIEVCALQIADALQYWEEHVALSVNSL